VFTAGDAQTLPELLVLAYVVAAWIMLQQTSVRTVD
jgi:hypothetical protein